jgi:hypothetical protein
MASWATSPEPARSDTSATTCARCSSSNRPALLSCDAGWPLATQWLPLHATAPADCAQQKDLQLRPCSEAAEGIRTLDLLHGKQSVGFPFAPRFSCKRTGSPARGAIPRLSPPNHGSLGTEWAPERVGQRAPILGPLPAWASHGGFGHAAPTGRLMPRRRRFDDWGVSAVTP